VLTRAGEGDERVRDGFGRTSMVRHREGRATGE
jgi:hypothetical protein